MRAKNRCDLLVLSLFLSVSLVTVHADIGGGSGTIITPYARDSIVTSDQINIVKKLASQSRRIKDEISLKGTHRTATGSRLGLSYGKGSRVGEPAFQFVGTPEQGEKKTIDLSEVSTFWVEKIDDNLLSADRALIGVIQFPVVTADELLQQKPTYSDLQSQFTRDWLIWVPLADASDNELRLVARTDRAKPYTVVANVRDIEEGQKVELDFAVAEWNGKTISPIWWATPSVVADRSYPLRIIKKK